MVSFSNYRPRLKEMKTMPSQIVTEYQIAETCPEPTCNLLSSDVEQFMTELEEYGGLFRLAFLRREQWEYGQTYLSGLLGDAPRKNVERMALEMGENVRNLQHYVGQSPWKKEPVVKIHQRLIAEMLGEADGVGLIDESGVVKQGDDTVGVASQYCGSVGKVANSQVGVHLGYVSRKGYTLLDSQLFMPEEWFGDEYVQRRQACGVPEDLAFQSKPTIALKLLQDAIDRNKEQVPPLPFRWVAADALYGDSPAFRDGIAKLDLWYFTEIKTTIQVWIERPEVYLPEWKGRGRCPTRLRLRHPEQKATTVQKVATQVPADGWVRATIKEGSKGPIVCNFAFLRICESRNGLPGNEIWLIIRRNVDDVTELKFYFSNAPANIALLELVRICGMRWPVEIIFKEGKGEIGFDHYETRSWLGWHHHMLLVCLAHHFLVRLRLKFKDKAPALTIDQVRLLLTSVLPRPVFNPTTALKMIQYYQKRNYVAYVCHRKAKLKQLGISANRNLAL
jgi:SRSO17 transposase